MLGCLETAQLRVSRRGRVVWQTLPGVSDAIAASWNRIADDVSVGNFTVSLVDDSCCPPPIHAKADLIEYVRNGVTEWAGVIDRFGDDAERVTIDASDLLSRYQRRVVHGNIALVGAELTAQIDAVRVDADSVDPVPLAWTSVPTTIATDLTINASEVRNAWEAMLEVAKAGADLTAVGARAFYGDLTLLPLRPLRLTEQVIIGRPVLGEASEGTATRVIATDGNGTIGVYPPGPPVSDPRYGLVEYVIEATDVPDPARLQAIAEAEWQERTRVPRFVAFTEGAWLSEDFPFTLGELIPGRVVQADLRNVCGNVSEQMRLSSVTYRVEGGVEQVRVELAPIGTTFESEATGG